MTDQWPAKNASMDALNDTNRENFARMEGADRGSFGLLFEFSWSRVR